jgi:hypothetical protein
VNALFGTASKPKVIIPAIMIMEVILPEGLITGPRRWVAVSLRDEWTSVLAYRDRAELAFLNVVNVSDAPCTGDLLTWTVAFYDAPRLILCFGADVMVLLYIINDGANHPNLGHLSHLACPCLSRVLSTGLLERHFNAKMSKGGGIRCVKAAARQGSERPESHLYQPALTRAAVSCPSAIFHFECCKRPLEMGRVAVRGLDPACPSN